MIYVIYHRMDFDGIGSAAIINQAFPDTTVVNVGYNHNDDIPDYENWSRTAKVYMLDVALPYEDMKKMVELFGDNLIWCDHHKSSMEEMQDLQIRGYRHTAFAGIQLTWKQVYQNLPEPNSVKMIANKDLALGDKRALFFDAGLNLTGIFRNPRSKEWADVLADKFSVEEKLVEKGKVVESFKKFQLKGVAKFIHMVELDGHIVPAVNSYAMNDVWDRCPEEKKDYTFYINYYRAKDIWKVSLRTDRDDVDLSAIAEKFGGGGHKKASGFVSEQLPFKFV